jgi:hypothetical protein
MDKINEAILMFVKPQRLNFSNLLYNEKEYFSHFDRLDFKLIAFDRVPLTLTLFRLKSLPASDKVCIYNHTHGSCRQEGAFLLRHCLAHGMSLCLYDSRGSGESGDAYVTFGHNEKVDLLFVVLKLSIEFGLKQVLFWGRSIGCTAIIQMFFLLVSNEGDFLNRRIELERFPTRMDRSRSRNPMGPPVHTQGSFVRAGSRQPPPQTNPTHVSRVPPTPTHGFARMSGNNTSFQPQPSNQPFLPPESEPQKKYPAGFNSFIYKHFADFLALNNLALPPGAPIEFRVLGIILDSPYTSVRDYIEDNIAKFVKILQGVTVAVVTWYFRSWMEKKVGVDIDKNSNCDIFPKLNLNAAFICSEKDDIIPLKRFNQLISSYAARFPNPPKPLCLVIADRHAAIRKHKDVELVLKTFFERLMEARTYPTRYIHLDYKNLIGQKPKKPELPPPSPQYQGIKVLGSPEGQPDLPRVPEGSLPIMRDHISLPGKPLPGYADTIITIARPEPMPIPIFIPVSVPVTVINNSSPVKVEPLPQPPVPQVVPESTKEIPVRPDSPKTKQEVVSVKHEASETRSVESRSYETNTPETPTEPELQPTTVIMAFEPELEGKVVVGPYRVPPLPQQFLTKQNSNPSRLSTKAKISSFLEPSNNITYVSRVEVSGYQTERAPVQNTLLRPDTDHIPQRQMQRPGPGPLIFERHPQPPPVNIPILRNKNELPGHQPTQVLSKRDYVPPVSQGIQLFGSERPRSRQPPDPLPRDYIFDRNNNFFGYNN